MKLVVKSRDLKWAGNRLVRGAKFEVTSERERPLADLLLKLGKVELAKEPAPFRRVATTRAPAPPEPAAEPAPETVEPTAEAPSAEAAEDPEAIPGRYRTRRLKPED